MIVGAGPVARLLGHELAASQSVKLIDTNSENCTIARGQGLETFQGNALHEEGLQLAGGHLTRSLIAMTSNDEVNLLAANLARETFRIPEVQVLWSQHPERAHELATGGRSVLKAPSHLTEWDLLALQGETERVGLEIKETADLSTVLAKLAPTQPQLLPLVVIRQNKALVLHEQLKLHPSDQLVVLRRRQPLEV
jgi:Trk K+ transport system NAD-binding subunit